MFRASVTSAVKAVLIFNVFFYAIRIVLDSLAVSQKFFSFTNIIVGELVHIFICVGSLYYLFG
jgi:hypothetical protein